MVLRSEEKHPLIGQVSGIQHQMTKEANARDFLPLVCDLPVSNGLVAVQLGGGVGILNDAAD
jgi:hypothetical protein